MYCNECGKEIDDNAAFCPECGAKVVNVPQISESEKKEERVCADCGAQIPDDALFCPECGRKIKKKGRKAGFVVPAAIAAVVVVGVFVFFHTFTGGKPEAVIDRLFDSFINMNAESVLSITPDAELDAIYETLQDEGYVGSVKEAKEYVINALEEDFSEVMSYYSQELDDFSYSYDVIDIEDMGREELAELNSDLREIYGDGFKATAYKTIRFTLNTVYEGVEEATEETLEVIKAGGKWCINPEEFDVMREIIDR